MIPGMFVRQIIELKALRGGVQVRIQSAGINIFYLLEPHRINAPPLTPDYDSSVTAI